MAIYPVITVEIAFASLPLSNSPTWVDVSAYVRNDPQSGGQPITIRRGRQFELNRIEAGTMRITLDNRDRRFDPTNASSPYYPNVVPMRRIRIRALSTFMYDIWQGFIQNWPPDWPDGYDSTVTLSCVDGFRSLSAAQMPLFIAEQLSGASIFGVLNPPFQWPTGQYTLDTGKTLAAAVNATMTPLVRIQDICTAEQGLFFIGPDGFAVFHDRHHRLTQTQSVTSQGTFGDSAAELPYVDINPSYDDTLIYNNIHVTPAGGSEQVASDATSQAAYFVRTLTKSGVPIGGAIDAANNEAASAAAWLLANYKDPHLRFDSISIIPAMDDNLWPQALFREISDRITVKRRPPGGGTLVQDCFIEGIAHEIALNQWRTTWQLSPVDALTYWVLNSTTLSVLGSTTRLGY